MMRKAFWTFLLPLAICGAAWAGGDHCNGDKPVAAHHHDGDSDKGHACPLAKGVSKSAKMTDDGAVVTLTGKTDEAVKAIQKHLESHKEQGEGADCPDCPFGMEGVNATVKVTDKGGEVTFSASNPETVKTVQEWAKKPAGACCGGMNKKPAA